MARSAGWFGLLSPRRHRPCRLGRAADPGEHCGCLALLRHLPDVARLGLGRGRTGRLGTDTFHGRPDPASGGGAAHNAIAPAGTLALAHGDRRIVCSRRAPGTVRISDIAHRAAPSRSAAANHRIDGRRPFADASGNRLAGLWRQLCGATLFASAADHAR